MNQMSPACAALQKPDHLISLATSGVLVCVDIKVWSATKQDRVISNEVTTSKNADKNSGRFVQNLLADHPKHKALQNYRQTVYNWLQRKTYQWNKAADFLPSAEVPSFKAEYNVHHACFEALKRDFLNDYDSIVSDQAFKQGTMFKRDAYPPKEQLERRFSMELYVNDVPLNDFRCAIAQDIADDLHATYSRQTEEIVSNVMREQQSRFIEVMESISHCCGLEEIGASCSGEIKTKKRKVYDSTINKAKAMCETFKQFNLTGNQELEDARAALEATLNGVDAELIRDSDAVRSNVKEGVDSILSKFTPFASFQ
jgi:hypothetical protein